MEQLKQHSQIKHLMNIIILLDVFIIILWIILIVVSTFISVKWMEKSISIEDKIAEINSKLDFQTQNQTAIINKAIDLKLWNWFDCNIFND